MTAELLSSVESIAFDKTAGHPVVLTMDLAASGKWHLHGIVSGLSQNGRGVVGAIRVDGGG